VGIDYRPRIKWSDFLATRLRYVSVSRYFVIRTYCSIIESTYSLGGSITLNGCGISLVASSFEFYLEVFA